MSEDDYERMVHVNRNSWWHYNWMGTHKNYRAYKNFCIRKLNSMPQSKLFEFSLIIPRCFALDLQPCFASKVQSFALNTRGDFVFITPR